MQYHKFLLSSSYANSSYLFKSVVFSGFKLGSLRLISNTLASAIFYSIMQTRLIPSTDSSDSMYHFTDTICFPMCQPLNHERANWIYFKILDAFYTMSHEIKSLSLSLFIKFAIFIKIEKLQNWIFVADDQFFFQK